MSRRGPPVAQRFSAKRVDGHRGQVVWNQLGKGRRLASLFQAVLLDGQLANQKPHPDLIPLGPLLDLAALPRHLGMEREPCLAIDTFVPKGVAGEDVFGGLAPCLDGPGYLDRLAALVDRQLASQRSQRLDAPAQQDPLHECMVGNAATGRRGPESYHVEIAVLTNQWRRLRTAQAVAVPTARNTPPTTSVR